MKSSLAVKVFAVLAILSLLLVALAPVIFSLAPSLIEAQPLDQSTGQEVSTDSETEAAPAVVNDGS